jgi:glycerophosphoryl diester phosphodiesterase
MTAFQRAVDLGYTYLETDVRVTADGVALAFHDATLDRLTDHRGRLDTIPWAVARRARVAGREPIALLADVLSTWPHTRINVDVKSSRAIQPTIDVVRRTGSADRVCIGAFATRRITAVRRAFGAGLCTSYGPAAVVSLRVAGRARARGAGCVEAPATVGGRPFIGRRYVHAAHAAGLPLIAYTVNRRREMDRLLDLGVAGIMTDRADMLREVLQERGQWQ